MTGIADCTDSAGSGVWSDDQLAAAQQRWLDSQEADCRKRQATEIVVQVIEICDQFRADPELVGCLDADAAKVLTDSLHAIVDRVWANGQPDPKSEHVQLSIPHVVMRVGSELSAIYTDLVAAIPAPAKPVEPVTAVAVAE